MAETNLEAAQAQIRRVIALLRLSGAPADASCAETLERELGDMGGRFAAKEALFRIGTLCHPKALGDRFIPGLTPDEWARELERLEGACADAFHELERSGP